MYSIFSVSELLEQWGKKSLLFHFDFIPIPCYSKEVS